MVNSGAKIKRLLSLLSPLSMHGIDSHIGALG